jgi:hypothetical protein
MKKYVILNSLKPISYRSTTPLLEFRDFSLYSYTRNIVFYRQYSIERAHDNLTNVYNLDYKTYKKGLYN